MIMRIIEIMDISKNILTSLFMLGVSSDRKWSHNIASQSTGGSGGGGLKEDKWSTSHSGFQ